ncbi:MAG: hypothetical protein IJ889_00565 [Eubacterium sp.]|nr:hypothetical protein [Eubacterium sp.]MBR2247447.1 hypothetical protein [Bacilli bacterium]
MTSEFKNLEKILDDWNPEVKEVTDENADDFYPYSIYAVGATEEVSEKIDKAFIECKFVSGNGIPNFKNIKEFSESTKYTVKKGDADSFGWLTVCIVRKSDFCLMYVFG